MSLEPSSDAFAAATVVETPTPQGYLNADARDGTAPNGKIQNSYIFVTSIKYI